MKEVLRRRFAPPLEQKDNILSSNLSFSMDASEFSCAKQLEMTASTDSPVIMETQSDLVPVTSTVETCVKVNDSDSEFSSIPEHQVVSLIVPSMWNH